MQQVQKQGLNVVLDQQSNPIAIIYRSNIGDWIIYTIQKATQDEIVELLTLQAPLDGASNLKK